MVAARITGEFNKSQEAFLPQITLFHCCNAAGGPIPDGGGYELKTVKMPCSGMTREVFLLRAFEAGADAVMVLVCPDGDCQHVSGNVRAAKRVARVKNLLDEIGLGGGRLNLFKVAPGDSASVEGIIKQTVAGLKTLGPNPASLPGN